MPRSSMRIGRIGVDRLIAYPLPITDADSVERALHQIGALIE